MKKIFLKIIGGAALTILAFAALNQITVSAQNGSEQAQGLEGVWNSQATFINCGTGAPLRTFPSMNTFIRGGTHQEFGVGSGFLRGPGHGVWSFQSQQRYSSSFQFFRFNADNTPAGRVVVRRQIDLQGDSYTAKSFIEFIDANDNLTGRGCATETGTRFQ